MRRSHPSASLIISILALFFALSGTAYAATGGTFLLGKSNTSTTVTSLANSKGTALNLSSTGTTPPLTVSNSVQVPNLNASKVGGQPASSFLPATGTAADSSKLGGTPASGFLQGGGGATGLRLALANNQRGPIASVPGTDVIALCDITNGGAMLFAVGTVDTGVTVMWWNKDGTGLQPHLHTGDSSVIAPIGTVPYIVVVRVDSLISVSTVTVTQWVDTSTGTCRFTSQVVTTNG